MNTEQNSSGLRLYLSNDISELAQSLCYMMKHLPLSDPFEPERILVQTEGMKRWLSLKLAQDFSISANVEFLSPNDLVGSVFGSVLDQKAEPSPYDFHHFLWGILKIFKSDFIAQPDMRMVQDYIQGNELKAFQLASQVSDLFDQYMIYRPELIESWDLGQLFFADDPYETWQKLLWNRYYLEYGDQHRINRFEALVSQVRALDPSLIAQTISRLWVFGISTLSPFHLASINALSEWVPVHFFYLNPTRFYWGDSLTPKREAALKQNALEKGQDPDGLYLNFGHRILNSMGRMGQHFIKYIYETYDLYSEIELYKDMDAETLLARLKQDILELHNRGDRTYSPEIEAPSDRLAVSRSDQSVQIVSCHSPQREVEVLYDELLSQFEADPALTPSDIIIMSTDIEAYTPFIESVFASADPTKQIPFSIADRKIRNESSVSDILMTILNLKTKRFEASALMSLLYFSAVQKKFGFSEVNVSLISHWIQATQIRWGIDDQYKTELGFPGYLQNTWLSGLNQLLLGYAMQTPERKNLETNETAAFDPLFVYDQIEGDMAQVLGRFVDFVSELVNTVLALDEHKSLTEWASFFEQVLTQFVHQDETTEREYTYLVSALHRLDESQAVVALEDAVEFDTIRSWMNYYLSQNSFGFGFISGGVTFCSMIPMRSIPFKFIGLLGLSDANFPRKDQLTNFNLLSRKPQLLDRSTRDSDRYLFFETLLSAQDKLYLSYVGRSCLDNSVCQPSVVVSELLDTINQGYFLEGTEDQSLEEQESVLTAHLTTQHPLKGYNPVYFKGEKPEFFSYSERNKKASITCYSSNQNPEFRSALNPLDSEVLDVTVSDFVSFFINPTRAFLNSRLGVRFYRPTEALSDTEPFEIDALTNYKLMSDMLVSSKHAKSWDASSERLDSDYQEFLSFGQLPHGSTGRIRFQKMGEEFRSLAGRCKDKMPPYDALDAHPITYTTTTRYGTVRITGFLDMLWPSGQVLVRPVKEAKPKDELSLWIYHLLLQVADAPPCPRVSHFLGIKADSDLMVSEIQNAEAFLDQLCELYWQGQNQLLPFVPSLGYTFCKSIKKESEAMQSTGTYSDDAAAELRLSSFLKLQGVWEQEQNYDNQDPYFSFVVDKLKFLQETESIKDQFMSVSEQIFNPYLARKGSPS